MIKVDTHQHFWNLSEAEYTWLVPAYGPIYATFEPHNLEPQLKAAGVDKTVVVQSANSYEDTASMLIHADYNDWIGAVIGWVNLLDPEETNRRIEMYKKHPQFRGIRHLIHEEKDPDWVVQSIVLESLKVLEQHNMVYEVVAVFPNHLKHVPTLAENAPDLKLVIDHLAKPPIKDKGMSPWSDQMRAAAQYPNVYAKVSGLNTAADWNTWSAADLKPYLDFTFEVFGADRMMFGGDWPVCLLAGGFNKVWVETQKAMEGRSQTEINAVLGGTAAKFYSITV
jgi:L-fuconolactonase